MEREGKGWEWKRSEGEDKTRDKKKRIGEKSF